MKSHKQVLNSDGETVNLTCHRCIIVADFFLTPTASDTKYSSDEAYVTMATMLRASNSTLVKKQPVVCN